MSIQTTLSDLGLNPKEIEVYLTLLEQGKTTPTTLSKITKINRATIYNITKSLISKGIIAEDTSGKVTYFIPLPLSNLEQIIARPMRELQDKQVLVQKAIDELSTLSVKSNYPVPKIRFVEEQDLENFLYENIEKWQKSVIEVDQTWWGIQDYTFIESYRKFNDWYWKQPFSKNVNMYQIGNDTEAEREALKRYEKDNRDVRFSSDINFSSSIWVGGDYLIMIMTRQHPHYLVEIHDKTLAYNMSAVFKKLWKDYQTNKKSN